MAALPELEEPLSLTVVGTEFMKPFFSASLAILALTVTAHATEPVSVGDLIVEHAWARATPPSAPTGAVYLTIANNGSEADQIVAIETPVAGYAMAHTTEIQDGVSRMREARPLEIAPGATLEMKPGGTHVMLMDLTTDLEAGDEITVTITFDKAGTVEVPVEVGAIGAMGPE
ncbi:copper chaperone PCu(A)C [Inquilinus sp. CAU 1745]|uniref:copper chaperone PCu(A)C n=1 Tax=Inquilinus sp. CAU 1745 TaxID=3140369 RepID=UPI00325A89C1